MRCEYCQKEMGSSSDNGCSVSHYRFTPSGNLLEFLKKQENSEDLIRIRTFTLPRIKVGDANDMFTSEEYKDMNIDRCPDCGAPVGTFHHEGCDNERCPGCGHQWISCDCGYYDGDYDIEPLKKLFDKII